ncbi:MAG TPA: hypothetical protein VJ969_07970, partial [Desulfopila sp.]|nr:hypothetical protein [Desulfopila sp.]
IILFFAANVFSGFNQVLKQKELFANDFMATSWLAANPNIELYRLLHALDVYVSGDPSVTSDDLLERFDIYWSRIPLLSQGQESASLRSLDELNNIAPSILASLKVIDPFITELQRGDLATYRQIRTALEGHAPQLRQLLLDSYHLGKNVNTQRQLDGRAIRYKILANFAGLFLGGGVLVLMFLWQLKERKLVEDSLRLANATLTAHYAERPQM